MNFDFDAWWKEMKPAECDEFKPYFEESWQLGFKDGYEKGVAAFHEAVKIERDQKGTEMDGVTVLPDGSAFFVGSFPLPKDHWLYAPRCEVWDNDRDTSADTPHPILDNSQRDAVMAAVRWAVRGATMNGTEPDFDPDALVLNAAYALCGPCGLVTPNVK